jgi:hypothetical protein
MADQAGQLKRAYDLIKANQKKDASKLIISVLKTDRNNAKAWLLLAHASSKKENAVQALQQVLRIQPDNDKARQMLTKLEGGASSPAPPPPAAPPMSSPPADDRFSLGSSADAGDRWSAPPQGISGGAAPDDAFAAPANDDLFAGSSFGAPDSSTPVEDDDPFADYNPAAANPDPFGATGGDPFAEDDPFSAPASSTPAASTADDPFAAPPADSSPAYDATPSYDPFGSALPSDEPPAPAAQAADPFNDDPFSSSAPAYDPFADELFGNAPAAQAADPFADDPFSPSNDPFSDDPFADVGSGGKAKNTAQPAKSGSGTNTVLIVVLIVAVVIFLGCGIGAYLLTRSMGEAATAMLESEEFAELIDEMATIEAQGGGGGSVNVSTDGLPSNLNMRGNVNVNQTVRGTLSAGQDDGWTVQGTAGQTIVIEMSAISADFDTRVYLYDSAGNWVGENDDLVSGGNTDSRLTIRLPQNDTYTIRASEFYGFGGDYELAVRPG